MGASTLPSVMSYSMKMVRPPFFRTRSRIDIPPFRRKSPTKISPSSWCSSAMIPPDRAGAAAGRQAARAALAAPPPAPPREAADEDLAQQLVQLRDDPVGLRRGVGRQVALDALLV